ncbi:phage integrase N-terminal SAM-like domain-containing protein, partial [Paraglaciecola sp.]|uniref:phage integrase N-terminal SAM-like domain-containing protein n=1 Tax=Paraglaciecola sp. TaxID=1920173 RepID=UPI00273D8B4A
RRLSPKTQIGYIRAVTKLATYLNHSPANATAEELRQFQIALAEQGTSNITINATLSGLQFLYCKTLNRPDVISKLALRNNHSLILRHSRIDWRVVAAKL